MPSFHDTLLSGCFRVSSPVIEDERGCFTKPFVYSDFVAAALRAEFKEIFWTYSVRKTLRGMHLQVPPHAHAKLVWCTVGEILDVTVDLRRSSPTYGVAQAFLLTPTCGDSLYVPPGVAHGFYVTGDRAVVAYAVTCEYSAVHDTGVLWKSIPYEWPDANPIVSERDRSLEHMGYFKRLDYD